MSSLFADSVYFIGLANPNDQYHSIAKAFDLTGRTLVTTRFVVTEVANSLSNSRTRFLFARLLTLLENWPDVAICPITDSEYHAGVELYLQRSDKDRSLTDCTSFVVMQREGITEALTADRHFEQAGFVAMLK